MADGGDRRHAGPAPDSLDSAEHRRHPEPGDGALPGTAAGVPGAYLTGLTAGTRRGDLPLQRRELLRMQRTAGNRAATRLVVQRIPPGAELPYDAAKKAKSDLGEDFDAKSDAEKITVIRRVVGEGKPDAMLTGWRKLSDEMGAARANPDLFDQSVKLDDTLLRHAPFADFRAKFRTDVESLARSYLFDNRALVVAEMARTGVSDEANGEAPTADQDTAVQDVQKLAPQIDRVRELKRKLRGTIVGTRTTNMRYGEQGEVPIYFDPARPPDASNVATSSWPAVNREWRRTIQVESALVRQSPSAAYFLKEEGPGTDALKNPADLKAARAAIATGLTDLAAKIDKAVPLIGDGITFLDMPPLQQQLLAGAPSASGTNWSGAFEKTLAMREIKDATIANLLTTLGLATVSAAFFILASLASGGTAALLAVLGAGASATQAGLDWKKYYELSSAHDATVDPELELVSGEQVDEALLSAILDSVFAAVDAWQGGKTAVEGIKAASTLRAGASAGASATARAALKTLGRAGVNDVEVLTKAIGELGPAEVRRLTGMSFEDMAKKVGGDLGKRLGELTAEGVSKADKELLEKLPRLAALNGEEGGKVLEASINTYGVIGTLDRAGGWAAIKKTAAMKDAKGGAAMLEAWRQGIVKELEDYIAKESENLSKAVRTGTEKASSDVDVQIVGGTAAELQQKAESWLAGRTGRSIEKSKVLLDAEIFVDPFRSHYYDIVKGIDDATRKDLAARMGDYERSMIAGAEIKKAGGIGTEAGKKAAQDWAEKGVKNPFLDFEMLSPGEQQKASSLVDGWMKQLEQAKTPEEKVALVEKISKTQAQINASHPDAYVGGGVRVWVTGREGEEAAKDVEKLAKAANMSEEDLLKATNAQRVMAALNESKWLEAAIGRLTSRSPGTAEDVGKVAKSVTDVGKHGARAAGQLSKAGAPNAAVLDTLFAELTRFKEMGAQEIELALREGRFSATQTEIVSTLKQLDSATKTAVKGLENELKTFSATAQEMAEFQRLLLWQVRYSELVNQSIQATNDVVRLIKTYCENEIGKSVQENEPNQSFAPVRPTSSAAPRG